MYERITPKVEDDSTSAEREGYGFFSDIYMIPAIPQHDLETCIQGHASGKRAGYTMLAVSAQPCAVILAAVVRIMISLE